MLMSSMISIIAQMKAANNVFKKYIDFIQFPHYRNIEHNTRINFDFPLTVFTGQNGCGKSSALHALYGAVQGNTPYHFWFDTKVDPIEYYDDNKRRHAFWYSYRSTSGKDLEVVKARIKREDDPNYWETSRPLKSYGMTMLKGKRNSPIAKNCLYLDFRSELSAFDQFFYFGNVRSIKSRNKQEYLRNKSRQLQPILYGEKDFQHNSKGQPLNDKLRILTQEELSAISTILGRTYEKGRILQHTLFRSRGYSVLLQSSFAQYSEAFAGSGEVAVVRLVTEILSTQPYSLILLDEPEVSLHPGAQKRLKNFLLDQIKKHKHQIVLNTHSPSLIDGLPREAIKVFNFNPNTKRFSVTENLQPNEAFFHIQYEIHKSIIYVEDKLAKHLIASVLDSMGAEVANLFKLVYHPGGAEVLKMQIIPVLSKNDNPNEFVVFDGDQKKIDSIDWRSLSHNELTVESLNNKIFAQTAHDVKFMVDGSGGVGNMEQKINLQKQYLDFYLRNIFYLPLNIPEEIIWNHSYADKLVASAEVLEAISVENDHKRKFELVAKYLFRENDSGKIFTVQQMFITKFIENQPAEYHQIVETVNTIKQSLVN